MARMYCESKLNRIYNIYWNIYIYVMLYVFYVKIYWVNKTQMYKTKLYYHIEVFVLVVQDLCEYEMTDHWSIHCNSFYTFSYIVDYKTPQPTKTNGLIKTEIKNTRNFMIMTMPLKSFNVRVYRCTILEILTNQYYFRSTHPYIH